jgi:hypothetical protein
MTAEFRLYYDAIGNVITYTTEQLAGDYIVVTREQYAEANPNVIVKNQQIVKKTARLVTKLTKSSDGIRTSKYDVNVITDLTEDFDSWVLQQYDLN